MRHCASFILLYEQLWHFAPSVDDNSALWVLCFVPTLHGCSTWPLWWCWCVQWIMLEMRSFHSHTWTSRQRHQTLEITCRWFSAHRHSVMKFRLWSHSRWKWNQCLLPMPFCHTLLEVALISDTYTLSQKNDTDVAQYNFNVHLPILVIFAEMFLSEYTMK